MRREARDCCTFISMCLTPCIIIAEHAAFHENKSGERVRSFGDFFLLARRAFDMLAQHSMKQHLNGLRLCTEPYVATRPFGVKSGLTMPIASGPARRPATVNRYSSCSSTSDRQSRWAPRAAGSTLQIGALATPPGPSAAPAASSSFPRGPLVNESTPPHHDWWQWLTSVVASAGRVAALALVVASLVRRWWKGGIRTWIGPARVRVKAKGRALQPGGVDNVHAPFVKAVSHTPVIEGYKHASLLQRRHAPLIIITSGHTSYPHRFWHRPAPPSPRALAAERGAAAPAATAAAVAAGPSAAVAALAAVAAAALTAAVAAAAGARAPLPAQPAALQP